MTTINDIEKLFRSNYSAMFVLACRLLHDDELAQDTVHDVFASLLKEKPPVVTTAYLFPHQYATLSSKMLTTGAYRQQEDAHSETNTR